MKCSSPRNGVGRLTSLSDESGTSDYFYDPRGNVTCKELTIAGEAFVVSYTYDAADRIATMTYPSGRMLTYERNAIGQVDRLTTTFEAVTKTVVENVEHAPFGRPIAWQFGNQLHADMPIDLSYRTTSITHGGVLDLNFDYDAADNIELITNALASSDSEAFQYDGNSRLIEAVGPYGKFDYGYDSNGNRTSYVVDDDPAGWRSSTYTYYANSNRLDAKLSGSGKFSFPRAYDEAGNTVSLRSPSGKGPFRYEYGDDGLLGKIFRDHSSPKRDWEISIFKNAFGQASYEELDVAYSASKYDLSRFIYDESGRLIAENPGPGRWYEYIYLDGRPVGYVADSFSLPRFSKGQRRRRKPVFVKKLSFIQTNHVGAPILATNESGNVAYRITAYKPFGGRTEGKGRGFIYPPLRIGLPGQIDSHGDFTIYNHFREYDAVAGRYLQSDPIGLDGGINTYAYANNNPLRFIDPLGLAAQCGDDEDCIEKCLRTYYGGLLDVALVLSPLSVASVVAGEVAEIAGESASGAANRDLNSGRVVKGQRIAKSVKLLKGAVATSNVVGFGALGFIAGAYGYCIAYCEIK